MSETVGYTAHKLKNCAKDLVEKLGGSIWCESHLGFGATPDVVTNAQFEELAAKGKITRPSDGKPAKSVVFVQSPGQGKDQDFPYAASVTSLVALKQASYVREDYADGKAFVIYQHMRTPGMTENFYKAVQQDPGIFSPRERTPRCPRTAPA